MVAAAGARRKESAVPIIRPDDPVRLVSSLPIISIEPNATLADLAGELERQQVGVLGVATGDGVDGVISERDLARAVAARADPDDVWVADLMSEDLVRIDGDEPVSAAAELMLDTGVRHLVMVVDGRVAGVVSVRDVLAVFADDWRRRSDLTGRGPG
jgi:CBS domain-containing protein